MPRALAFHSHETSPRRAPRRSQAGKRVEIYFNGLNDCPSEGIYVYSHGYRAAKGGRAHSSAAESG